MAISPPQEIPTSDTVWSVYIVRCRDGALYTGIAVDVARRFRTHVAGAPKGAKYLRGKGPLTLVFQEAVGSRSLASKVEHRIKRLRKREKEALVNTGVGFDRILAAAIGLNPRSRRES